MNNYNPTKAITSASISISEVLLATATENGVKEEKKNTISMLYELVIKHNILGFVDFNNNFYLYLPKYNKVVSAKSDKVVEYFKYYLYADCVLINCNSKLVSEFLGFIEYICKGWITEKALDVKTHAFRRCGGLNDKIYLDLKNTKGLFVEIDSNGWNIIEKPPIILQTSEASLPLPLPEVANRFEVMQLKKFLNCNDDYFKLVICYLVHCLFPESYNDDKVILVLEGKTGSAKSTTSKIIRSIIDPQIADTIELKRNTKDLLVRVEEQWLVVFDNISEISDDFSDTLCRLSTTAGHSERQLYTNNKINSYSIKRPMVINGISNFILKEDLLDRCIILSLQSLEKQACRSDFWQNFEKERPKIIGALLSLLSEVLKTLPNIECKENFRMSDFAKIGCAVETSLQWQHGEFCRIYRSNITEMSDENINHILSEGFYLKETPANLFKYLRKHNQDNSKINNTFPNDVNIFAKGLYRLEATLRKNGIMLEKDKSGIRRDC